MGKYFQDQLTGNHCFGCGPDNSGGLRIKSFWANEDVSRCEFRPDAHHSAAPTNFINGGIIATIIDCHCICTAIAYAYREEEREIGEGEDIWYVTSKLNVTYLRPTPLDSLIILNARVTAKTDKIIELACSLESNDKECATAVVTAVAVPSSWMLG